MAISLALSSFLHHWALLFLPYQIFPHFRTLFDFFTELTLYRNVTAQGKVYLLYLTWSIFSLENLYFWAFLPSPMDRLRQGDVVNLVMQTDTFYLVTLALAPMLMYNINVICFGMKAPYLRLLEDITFRDTHGTLNGIAYGRITEQKTARIILLVVVNLLHGFMIVIDAVLWFLIYSLIVTATENAGELFGSPLETPLTFIWNVICMILGTCTTVTSWALYGKVMITVSAVGITQVCVLFRRLYHSETLLVAYGKRERTFSWAPLRHYLTYSGKTFQILFLVNDVGGRLFLAFLVVHMPISAWALVQLALGDLSQWSSIALSGMPAHELIGCILFHWAVAKLTKRLHAPSKTLLALNASTGHRMGNFRARLLLHHTIVRLHSKAKYGFTYGSVGGLITMGSFAKCMLLYIELLMYAYKLIRDF